MGNQALPAFPSACARITCTANRIICVERVTVLAEIYARNRHARALPDVYLNRCPIFPCVPLCLTLFLSRTYLAPIRQSVSASGEKGTNCPIFPRFIHRKSIVGVTRSDIEDKTKFWKEQKEGTCILCKEEELIEHACFSDVK